MLAMREAEMVMQADPIFQELGYDFNTGEYTHRGTRISRGGLRRLVNTAKIEGFANNLGLGKTTALWAIIRQAALSRSAQRGGIGNYDPHIFTFTGLNTRQILASKRTELSPELKILPYQVVGSDGHVTLKRCPDEEGISHEKAPLMRGFLLGGEILKVLLRSLLPTSAILHSLIKLPEVSHESCPPYLMAVLFPRPPGRAAAGC